MRFISMDFYRNMNVQIFSCLLLLCLLFTSSGAWAQATFEVQSTGNWNAASTWNRTSGSDADGIPDADDDVVFPSSSSTNYVVTVTADAEASSVVIIGGNGDGGTTVVREIIINDGETLTVTGDVTLYGPTGGGADANLGRRAEISVGSSGAATNATKLIVGGDLNFVNAATGQAQVRAALTMNGSSSVELAGDMDLRASYSGSNAGQTPDITATSTNEIIMNGSSSASILGTTGGGAVESGFNLTVNKNAGATAVTIDYDGLEVHNLTVTQGTVQAPTSGSGTYDLSIAGDISNNGTIDFENAVDIDITFNGSSNQLISGSGTFSGLAGVTYNNTGGASNNNIEIQSASFSNAISAGNSIFTAGTFIHNNSGTYNAFGNSNATVGCDLQILAGRFDAYPSISGNRTLTLNGDLTVNNATFDAENNNGGSNYININLNGDANFSNGASVQLGSNTGTSSGILAQNGNFVVSDATTAVDIPSRWFVNNNSTVTINNGIITAGKGYTASIDLIQIESNVTFTMNAGSLTVYEDANTGNSRGFNFDGDNSDFNITGGTVTVGNAATGQGCIRWRNATGQRTDVSITGASTVFTVYDMLYSNQTDSDNDLSIANGATFNLETGATPAYQTLSRISGNLTLSNGGILNAYTKHLGTLQVYGDFSMNTGSECNIGSEDLDSVFPAEPGGGDIVSRLVLTGTGTSSITSKWVTYGGLQIQNTHSLTVNTDTVELGYGVPYNYEAEIFEMTGGSCTLQNATVFRLGRTITEINTGDTEGILQLKGASVFSTRGTSKVFCGEAVDFLQPGVVTGMDGNATLEMYDDSEYWSAQEISTVAGGNPTRIDDNATIHLRNNAEFNVATNANTFTGGNVVNIGANTSATAKLILEDNSRFRASENLQRITGGNAFVTNNNASITISGGAEMHIGDSLHVIEGGNLVNIAGTSSITVNSGASLFVAQSPDIEVPNTTQILNLQGASTLLVDGGTVSVAQNLPIDTSNGGAPKNINAVDVDNGTVTVQNNGTLNIGGSNVGNMRMVGNGSQLNLSSGTVNIRASLDLSAGSGNDKTVTVTDGTLNIGVERSLGSNTLIFPANPGGANRFSVTGGTVNIGDGNSLVMIGNGNNNPAFGSSADYQEVSITGTGVMNLYGRLLLDDANARLIIDGGEVNVDPQGGSEIPISTETMVNLNRGIVNFPSGTLRFINPVPNSGSGLALVINALGDPSSGAALSGSTTANSPIDFSSSTIAFGDGASTIDNSPDGFEVTIDGSHTYGSFLVNNPGNTSTRFVDFETSLASISHSGDFNIIAGEVRMGDNDIGSPASSGAFSLGANAILRLSHVDEFNHHFPGAVVGGYSSYSIDASSTVIYDGAGNGLMQTDGTQAYGNVTIAGTGNKTFQGGPTIRGTLRLEGSTAINNFTMASGSKIQRAGTNTAGILNPGVAVQGGNDYTIEYVGVSKITQTPELSGTGTKSLVVNVDNGDTLSLHSDYTIQHLTLSAGVFKDSSHTLTVNGNISNSAMHVSESGKILLSGGSVIHTLSGNGSGVFGKLELDDVNGITLSANQKIDSSLTLTNGIFNIGEYQLTFGTGAITTDPSSLDATRMILLAGTLDANGVIKEFDGTKSFTYPIGVSGKYTPATVNIHTATLSTSPATVTIKSINEEHPLTTDDGADGALDYYWRVRQSGFSAQTASLHFTYDDADIDGNENVYIPSSIFLDDSIQWRKINDQNKVEASNNIIRFDTVAYLQGDYTTGELTEFSTVTGYYSLGGAWEDGSSWSIEGYGGPPAGSSPASSKPVFIGDDKEITINQHGFVDAAVVTIEANGTLTIADTTSGVDLGDVQGTGLLNMQSEETSQSPTFPNGAFGDFLSKIGGTVQYSGTADYTLPSAKTSYNNVIISGGGTKVTPIVGTVSLEGNLSVINGTILSVSDLTDSLHVKGNVSVTGSSSQIQIANTAPQMMRVDGDVSVGTGAIFDVSTTGVVREHNIYISGSLSNTGTFDMNPDDAPNAYRALVTFDGTSDATISGTGATDFERLIINKGSSQTPVLQVAASATNLSITGDATAQNKPLTLLSGTLRYSAATADTIDLSVSTTTAYYFSIPSTARLWLDHANALMQIGGTHDHYFELYGTLRITNGKMIIGSDSVGAGVTPDNDLLYYGTEGRIEVSGGELQVSGQLRPNGAGAALAYVQSGGTVHVGRYRASETGYTDLTNGDFVLNDVGSYFEMSGGKLIDHRKRPSADGIGILIEGVTNYSVTGGTVQVVSDNQSNNHDVAVSSQVPFWNFQVGDGSGFTGRVGGRGINSINLTVLNDFTINIPGGIFKTSNATAAGQTSNRFGLYVGGDLTVTNGTFLPNLQNNSDGTVTFNGSGNQVITDASGELSLHSLIINKTAGTVQLASGTDLLIEDDFTLTAGSFDPNGQAVKFAASQNENQNISGNITFYDLEIDKSSSTTNSTVFITTGSVTVQNDLTLTDGIFDIDEYALVLENTANSAISGSGFSATKMIKLSGAVSAQGITKSYPNPGNSIIFPIGTTVYTPATINVTDANGATGTVNLKAINARHPSASSSSSLAYYWQVQSTGFNDNPTISFDFTYDDSDIAGTEASYVDSYFSSFTWTANTGSVNTSTNTFSLAITGAIDADFTAGEDSFVDPAIYYSWQSGNWNDVSTWTINDSTVLTPPATEPTYANPVFIRNHTVTMTTNNDSAQSVDLLWTSSMLNVQNTSGHDFGSGIRGSGILRTLSNSNMPALSAAFIASGGGTIEFYNVDANVANPTVVNNLMLTSVGGGDQTQINADITVNGNVIINITGSGSRAEIKSGGSLNRSALGGSFTMLNNSRLRIEGDNFPENFGTYAFSAGSTVGFDNNVRQDIPALNYGNLRIATAGSSHNKNLLGDISVQGNLEIGRRLNNDAGDVNTGATLVTNNHNINVAGDFELLASNNITFGTTVVTFNGTAAQNIEGGESPVFYDLDINNGASVVLNGVDISVSDTLDFSNGDLNLNGQTFTLTGAITGTGGAFSGSSSSNLVVNGSGAAGTLTFNSGSDVLNNFTMNRSSSGEITLGSKLTIEGTLSLTDGNIVTGAEMLLLNNTVTPFTGGSSSSFIQGPLAINFGTSGSVVSRVFHIGEYDPELNSVTYRPVTIEGQPSAATLMVKMINAGPVRSYLELPLIILSSIRYYQADLLGGSFTGDQKITLSYHSDVLFEEEITNPGDLRIARSTNATSWYNAGLSAGSNTLPDGTSTSDVTTFASPTTYFALASISGDNPLPVELASYEIEYVNGHVVLKWATATETDNIGFVVSRADSSDGEFEEIGSYSNYKSLKGQGTSVVETQYQFVDYSNTLQAGGTYLYKLEDVNIAGAKNKLEVKTIKLPDEYSLEQNYPNPFNPATTILFSLKQKGMTTLSVYNVLGQKVATLKNEVLEPGAYTVRWNAAGYASGIYFYRLISGDFVKVKKMMLLK